VGARALMGRWVKENRTVSFIEVQTFDGRKKMRSVGYCARYVNYSYSGGLELYIVLLLIAVLEIEKAVQRSAQRVCSFIKY
jgi:hypothetical protein